MKKIIISIGREFGSGGRRIGELLAKELEVPCYDRHLIEEAACCSGFETKELEEADEMKANRFLFKVPAKSNQYTGYGKPMNDTLFAIQSELIRKYADAGSCVIVGRCADKVLEKQEGLISVFIYAQMIAASIDSIKDSLDTLASKSYVGASEILKGAERLSSDVSARSEISRRIESFSDKIILHSQKISDMSINLEHSVEQIDDVSEISVRQAENALGGLEKMNKLMSGLEACASDFSESIGEIFASGRKIGAVVESMTQLADRANLLSLNASIEAKKAGKCGEGFAVVADRLRKLADQTSTATLEIENIVKAISSLSEAGSKKVGEFDSKFSDVSAQSKKVNEGLSEIIQKVQGIPPRLTLLLDGIRTQNGEGDSIKSYARALKKAVDDESKLMDSAREISDNLSKTALSVRREAGKHRM